MLAIGMAVPAAAQTAYFPVTGGPQSPTFIAVTVPVKASIGGSCNFATTGTPNGSYAIPGFVDTNTTWSNDFAMTLECTGPSRLAISSLNGGLQTAAAPSAPGYTNLAPYTVDVNVVRTGGTTTGTCPAEALKSGSLTVCDLRGTASASVGLAIPTASFGLSGSYVRVKAPAVPAADILINGGYSDTLIITVSPAS